MALQNLTLLYPTLHLSADSVTYGVPVVFYGTDRQGRGYHPEVVHRNRVPLLLPQDAARRVPQ